MKFITSAFCVFSIGWTATSQVAFGQSAQPNDKFSICFPVNTAERRIIYSTNIKTVEQCTTYPVKDHRFIDQFRIIRKQLAEANSDCFARVKAIAEAVRTSKQALVSSLSLRIKNDGEGLDGTKMSCEVKTVNGDWTPLTVERMVSIDKMYPEIALEEKLFLSGMENYGPSLYLEKLNPNTPYYPDNRKYNPYYGHEPYSPYSPQPTPPSAYGQREKGHINENPYRNEIPSLELKSNPAPEQIVAPAHMHKVNRVTRTAK